MHLISKVLILCLAFTQTGCLGARGPLKRRLTFRVERCGIYWEA